MNRTPVQSSNVASVGYDPNTLTLEIEFTNSSVYQYFDVPEIEYYNLVRAESVGRYLNLNIKNSYRYVKT
ncbi:MAG: KTSC domain-containing protein [Desulfobacteraceae bacterium]|nr:MAG: KTSC domain-containing protein [Desulfobacteraceae bacterium]